METREFVNKITEAIFSKKGSDVKVLDLRKISTIADYFVICSADSDTQVKAIADEVDKVLSEEGIKSSRIEGYQALNWILMDYFDVVIHIFKNDTRTYYNLEKLWGDAPTEALVDPRESTH
ncbi:MAG TPA: ribosome silencing factor [Ignavibacteriales bacterium]|nr:ribosome silencing factor [Ignavibacteriales bacterium]HEX3072965.1 ribosome silencing factor [Ignavibacteriales bacterium]